MTKIIGSLIRWRTGWGNCPDIYLTFEDEPDRDGRLYEAIPMGNGETYYYAVNDNLVSALYHNPRWQDGFGGRVFHLKMKDGTERDIKGPWDYGTATFNKLTGLKAVEIAYLWPQKGNSVFYASMYLVKPLQEYLWSLHPKLTLSGIPTEATKSSDEQRHFILAGETIKPNTTVFELDKEFRHMLGYFTMTDGYRIEDCFTIFGDMLVSDFFINCKTGYVPRSEL